MSKMAPHLPNEIVLEILNSALMSYLDKSKCGRVRATIWHGTLRNLRLVSKTFCEIVTSVYFRDICVSTIFKLLHEDAHFLVGESIAKHIRSLHIVHYSEELDDFRDMFKSSVDNPVDDDEHDRDPYRYQHSWAGGFMDQPGLRDFRMVDSADFSLGDSLDAGSIAVHMCGPLTRILSACINLEKIKITITSGVDIITASPLIQAVVSTLCYTRFHNLNTLNLEMDCIGLMEPFWRLLCWPTSKYSVFRQNLCQLKHFGIFGGDERHGSAHRDSALRALEKWLHKLQLGTFSLSGFESATREHHPKYHLLDFSNIEAQRSLVELELKQMEFKGSLSQFLNGCSRLRRFHLENCIIHSDTQDRWCTILVMILRFGPNSAHVSGLSYKKRCPNGLNICSPHEEDIRQFSHFHEYMGEANGNPQVVALMRSWSLSSHY